VYEEIGEPMQAKNTNADEPMDRHDRRCCSVARPVS
jgi:hypothetical protein